MNRLRTVRIVLAVAFLTATVASLVFGLTANPMGRALARLQITPTLTAMSLGVALFWLIVSLFAGRVYCSTVCPIGTLQDIVIWLRRHTRFRRPFSWRPARRTRIHIFIIYVVCLVLGVGSVSFWLEPWSLTRNICAVVNPTEMEGFWIATGIGTTAGIISGVISFILIVVCALLTGRGFCTSICPVGTFLASVDPFTVYHIEIDPDKCISCMKCEEICKCHCVKVVSRYVDNSRCVRCFDCTAVCPNDAIRLQANRNRRATPLLRRPVSDRT